ncbi:allantoinase AllB [Rhodococcus sp. IEGM 1408]|uniref:allantoinase AllB n=1 Tax=Rhodococcus sp. IEGM 1408 TaxID=3082220 RepID=UPI0029539827|nr:allantoinase AllB [Rhodococcus sp. IEGM 1408]MDV8001481.1 allantoinase AllB [Rhodococcus sp. IEGM 1408]
MTAHTGGVESAGAGAGAATPGGDLVIRARRAVVGAVVVPATITVSGGLINAVDTGPGALTAAPPAGATVVDLDDDEVLLPGLVDTHVHVNEPGRTDWEGFTSATRAAACGGVTTLIDMPLNSSPVTTSPDALDAKLASTAGKLHVDAGFWGGAVPENLGRLRELWDRGVFGFKCFLLHSGIDEFPPLDPEQMEAAMAEIAEFDGLLIVHAEDAGTIDAQSEPSGPAYAGFLDSRPVAAEILAIQQVIDGVRRTGCRAHILHLSAAAALPLIRAAKAEGLPLTVETCPHYLSLFSEEIQPGATHYKCCPPIRDAGNREGLWEGLRDGTIDIVVSDHSPCVPELKRFDTGDFGQAWGGIASVQLGLPIIWSEARRREMGLPDVVRWMASGPAEFAGLADRGAIRPGARADLVVLAPDDAFVVLPERLQHKNPVTAYAERALAGVVREVYLAGRRVDLERPAAGHPVFRPGAPGDRPAPHRP